MGGRWNRTCRRIHIIIGLSVQKRNISADKGVEYVSDRMSYIILRGRWCHIIVLNVHAPTEDRTDVKNSFYEELERVFDNFPKYHTKILFADFYAKGGTNDIFIPTIRNESLHEISNDNEVRLVNTSESKVRCFHIETSINILGNPQSFRLTTFW
jgi:hypothetical protein